MTTKTLSTYRELIWTMAKTDFKLRYHGSILGFVWVILKPLFTFMILNFVFTNVFKGGIDFSMGMFTSLVLWGFFAEGTMVGMTALQAKAHIITKIYVPKWTIVVAATLNTLLSFILILLVVSAFLLYHNIIPNVGSILIAFYYCTLTYLLILGFSFFTAPFFLKVRDLNQIWEVILTAGFYVAPVIYPIESIPAHLQQFLYLNPMTFVVVHVKNALIYNTFSFPLHHLLYLIFVIIVFCTGMALFQKTSQRAAENV